jgi:hypothetical protein
MSLSRPSHSHPTRFKESGSFLLPKVTTAMASRSVHYRSIQTWNHLPQSLRNICTKLSTFQTAFRDATFSNL